MRGLKMSMIAEPSSRWIVIKDPHLILTPEAALELAQQLIESVRQSMTYEGAEDVDD
jgi:hypothetical protein